jgi:hypothetical protein
MELYSPSENKSELIFARALNIKEMRTAMPNGHADSTLQLREPTLHDDRGKCRPIITTMHRNISRKRPFEERLTEIL